MAKTFLNLFKEVKEQVYSADAQALVVLASLNSVADFTPNLAPNGVKGTTSQFTLQRRKRPSVNTVAKANTGATTDALAALDQFSTIDWVSSDVVTGALKSVGFKGTFSDDYDFSENPKHAQDMKYIMGEQALERKAQLIALLDTITATAALPAYAKGDSKVWDAIADKVIELGLVEDEFKSKQGLKDFVIYVSASVAKDLAKEMGQAFNQEAPIAETGFTSKNSVNGTPVIVDTTLAAGTAYVMHKEALAFKSDMIEKDINVNLGINEYVGRAFYDVQALVDAARVFKFTKATA